MRRIVIELGTRALFFLCGCAAAIILAHGVGLLRRAPAAPALPDAHAGEPRAIALKMSPSELRRTIAEAARAPPGDPHRAATLESIREALLTAVDHDPQREQEMHACIDRALALDALDTLSMCVDMLARP